MFTTGFARFQSHKRVGRKSIHLWAVVSSWSTGLTSQMNRASTKVSFPRDCSNFLCFGKPRGHLGAKRVNYWDQICSNQNPFPRCPSLSSQARIGLDVQSWNGECFMSAWLPI
ncbi:hypothetical protein EV356DRAFT_390186 [Viridothelium virens]|uniref:Uncharacterized protein n=1 Tax=Viridothelium virens TaxID=1048519 RepID=A0A6A6GUM7_VIRVR|nr:hypothetical protein EV356DRAFT_390186 [Viridothelium virens]